MGTQPTYIHGSAFLKPRSSCSSLRNDIKYISLEYNDPDSDVYLDARPVAGGESILGRVD